jgi:DNA-binding response OmpR family regulator
VVIISGETSGERIDNLMAVGASAYLTKPISVRDFLHTVDALLTRPASAAAGPGAQAGAGAQAAAGAQAREAALQPETAQRDDAKPEDAAPDQPWSE